MCEHAFVAGGLRQENHSSSAGFHRFSPCPPPEVGATLTVAMTTHPTAVDGIRLCRTQAHLSARALSIQAGLGDSYVSKVEAGSIAPSLKAFSRIVVVLGLNDAEIAVLVRLAATESDVRAAG